MNTPVTQPAPLCKQLAAVKAYVAAAKLEVNAGVLSNLPSPTAGANEAAQSAWQELSQLIPKFRGHTEAWRYFEDRLSDLRAVDRAVFDGEGVTHRELSMYASEGLISDHAVHNFNLAEATYLKDRLVSAEVKPGDLLVNAAKGYLNANADDDGWDGLLERTFMEAVEAPPPPTARGSWKHLILSELERAFDIFSVAKKFATSQELTFFITGGALSVSGARALLDAGQRGLIPRRAVDIMMQELGLPII